MAKIGYRPLRPPLPQANSHLLMPEENHDLIQLIGSGCQSMATAVIQLFLTEPPTHSEWVKKACAVACFVKDNVKRSYFIRIYDIANQKQQIWEQELYGQFQYCTPKTVFHTFEAQSCRAGINFVDEQEANQFKTSIQERLTIFQRRMTIRRPNRNNVNNNPSATGVRLIPPANTQRANSNTRSNASQQTNTKLKNNKKLGLSKADIGAPIHDSFQHICHVGWNPESGFNAIEKNDGSLNPQLRTLFEEAGILRQNLDQETLAYIHDVMDKNNIYDKLHQLAELEDHKESESVQIAPQPPPVPGRNVPVSRPGYTPSPVLPSRILPPVPGRVLDKFHTPTPPRRKNPPPISTGPPQFIPPPPPLSPLPPPPPPLSTLPPPLSPLPPPPPTPSYSTSVSNMPLPPPPLLPTNSQPLTSSVSVQPGPAPPPPPPPPPLPPPGDFTDGAQMPQAELPNYSQKDQPPKVFPAVSARDLAMSEIRQGVKLKPVDKDINKETQKQARTSTYSEMAMILRTALDKRAVALQNSDDEDGEEWTEEDEWDE